jgi:hypothetical protein
MVFEPSCWNDDGNNEGCVNGNGIDVTMRCHDEELVPSLTNVHGLPVSLLWPSQDFRVESILTVNG